MSDSAHHFAGAGKMIVLGKGGQREVDDYQLSRCKWGHDDYSLRVENLPQKPPEPGQQALDF